MKRLFAYLLLLSMLLCGCAPKSTALDEKLNVVTTIFAYYDFVRAVAGDKAEVNMLIKPSTDVHSYEPTPEDIINTSKSDLFVYTGGNNDKWAQTVIENTNTQNTLKLLDVVKIQDEHDHQADEHIWTSPKYAAQIVNAISLKLCEIDPKNKDYYTKNAEAYVNELNNLDNEIMEVTKNSKRNTILFGDRFPFKHFTDRYNLNYYSAFGGCADESEPDAKTVAWLCDKVKEENIPVVFYIEMSSDKMAKAISENTKAKVLMLHSCHSVSVQEFERGESYLSLMKQNLINLKEALN